MWEHCRLTGDTQPLWELLMACVQEEDRGSNVCASGRAAGELNAGNTGKQRLKWLWPGAFLREEPSPAHLAQRLGVVGLFSFHLTGVQMHGGSRKRQAQPGFGIPGFGAPLE